jgi:phosphatidylserine/phosphatidylglycerophosphate/cardiolipin synthase-like enzyme
MFEIIILSRPRQASTESRKKVSLPRAFIAAAMVLALCSQGRSDPAPTIHYAPAENLEHVDVDLIDRAEHEIDMAAYVLTDWPVLQALTRAADRGVAIRIYLDGTQLAEREPAKVFNDLAETPGVEIRIKHKSSAPAPQKLPNRRAIAAHRRRESLSIRPQASGQ